MKLTKHQWRVLRAVLDRIGPRSDPRLGLWMSGPGCVYAASDNRLVRFSLLDVPRLWEDHKPGIYRATYNVTSSGTEVSATREPAPMDHFAMIEKAWETKRKMEPKIARISVDGRLLDVLTLAAKCTPSNKLHPANVLFAGELGEIWATVDYDGKWRFDILIAPCRV